MIVDINSDRSENVKYDYSFGYADFPVYVRRALLSAYPGFAADSHWHDDIELILILTGKMHYGVNGEIVVLNKGEGINTTDKTILEISLAVGFSGASCFPETFRKSFGVSPTEYRKAR